MWPRTESVLGDRRALAEVLDARAETGHAVAGGRSVLVNVTKDVAGEGGQLVELSQQVDAFVGGGGFKNVLGVTLGQVLAERHGLDGAELHGGCG
jgi:hypothetical protein